MPMPTEPAASSSERVPTMSTPAVPVPSSSATPSLRPRWTRAVAPSIRAFERAGVGRGPRSRSSGVEPDHRVDRRIEGQAVADPAPEGALRAGEDDDVHPRTMPS